jgi:hypothetical protein
LELDVRIRTDCIVARIVPLQIVHSQPHAWMCARFPECLDSAVERFVQPPLVAGILDHQSLEIVGVVFERA